jgi:hypothetical protein
MVLSVFPAMAHTLLDTPVIIAMRASVAMHTCNKVLPIGTGCMLP